MSDGVAGPTPRSSRDFLDGGGDTGALMRAADWAATPLGPPQHWPQPLKTMVALLLAADQAMFLCWGPDNTLFYNDAYAPMLADRHPGAMARPIFEVWTEIRADIEPLFTQVFAGRSVNMADLVLQMDRPGRPAEAHFAFSYTPVRDVDGTIRGLFCACIETTEDVFAERARRAAEANERARLWDLSEDMLARANFEGTMSAVNPAWTAVLGWDRAHLLGTPYAEFMHPDDAGVTLAALAEMGRTGQPTRFQNRIATKDGRWTPIGWTVSPEPDGINFIAVGRDLSEDKAREAELAHTQEALRQSQKLEAMGQLTGGVAHDFNNLLTPIIGSLDMLLRRQLGGEREQRLIDGALQSAERARVLVQRLLAFARRQPLQPTAVDLGELVDSMASLLASTLGPNVTVAASAAAGLPPALADRNQLEMALLNLAVNAGDAMPHGGKLTIAASEHRIGPDHPTGLPPGRYVSHRGRYRRGDGRGDQPARDRAVLLHQGCRQGHRTGLVDGARAGRPAQRRADHPQRPGRRHHRGAVAARQPRIGRDRSGSAARRVACRSHPRHGAARRR